ncbi:MAG: HEAT repeat domain-containing protein [Verrucomicrobiota bacterium]
MPRLTIALAALLVLLALGLALKPGAPEDNGEGTKSVSEPATTSVKSEPPASTAPPSKQASESQAPVDPIELEATIEELVELSTTQSPSAIPRIAAYFEDPNPEIRAAAIESIVQLGETAAIPYLLKAAESATSPEEAMAFKDAAEFLELPPDELIHPPSS